LSKGPVLALIAETRDRLVGAGKKKGKREREREREREEKRAAEGDPLSLSLSLFAPFAPLTITPARKPESIFLFEIQSDSRSVLKIRARAV
jgi:hypothetical protein